MKSIFKAIIIFLALGVISCKEQPKASVDEEQRAESITENKLVPESWITKRVEKSKERLGKTEAGKIIWNAMQAHGGLARWYGNGALSFRFDYKPLDGSTQRDSYQTIDTWSNRARHTSASDSTAHFGWTGDTSWIKAKDSTAFAYDTKFWALTPIYFLGQPFVLDGKGVNLALLPQEIYKEKTNDVVKVTFDSGTGDAPNDYYILYFDNESHLLTVIRYIVSYPSYFKEGGHSPEKFMDVIGSQIVEGMTFPKEYKTHMTTKDGLPGEYITQIKVSSISFKKELAKDYFGMPEGANIVE